VNYPILKLDKAHFPALLTEIPDPPKELWYRGILPPHGTKSLAVVGSRNYTSYGKQCVEKLIGGLRGYDIAIISGLALGIDALAHNAALDAGLYTLAVPGSGLDDNVLYPARHKALASRILGSGGGLLSEFPPDFTATPWSFPKRNRIMAGLSHAVLIIEATEKSGTLITSRLATEYNRDVLAVPGDIFSESTKGPHMLIKLGAIPVTTTEDILYALDMEPEETEQVSENIDLTPEERIIFDALIEPKDKDELVREAKLDTKTFNATLTLMELKNIVVVDMNIVRRN